MALPFIDREQIRIRADGTWETLRVPEGFDDGIWEEITHPGTLDAFRKIIHRDDEGYFIQIKHETKRIQVEDTAYFVIGLDGNPDEGWTLRLSDGAREKLDPTTLSYRPGRLTTRISRDGKEESAKFLQPAYSELLGNLDEDETGYFVVIEGTRIQLETKK